MRELCFRGKVTAEYAENHELLLPGDWVGGGILPLPNFTFILCDSGTERVPVDPETVGQFTGLRDKNGVRIFEGDIIKHTYDGKIQTFGNCGFGAVSFKNAEFYVGGTVNAPLSHCFEFSSAEVVGNVHDNPDLLKAGDTPEARIGRLKKRNGLEVTQ